MYNYVLHALDLDIRVLSECHEEKDFHLNSTPSSAYILLCLALRIEVSKYIYFNWMNARHMFLSNLFVYIRPLLES